MTMRDAFLRDATNDIWVYINKNSNIGDLVDIEDIFNILDEDVGHAIDVAYYEGMADA